MPLPTERCLSSGKNIGNQISKIKYQKVTMKSVQTLKTFIYRQNELVFIFISPHPNNTVDFKYILCVKSDQYYLWDKISETCSCTV